MEKISKINGIAAPIPIINIDTDMIIPKQFLKTVKKSGLGKSLFYEMRYDLDGKKEPQFILNRKPYDQAKIIIAEDNFGCGSSREHAPWAIKDFGIRAVIAPSFADIFFNNCFKNGILAIVLPQEKVRELLKITRDQQKANISIDLIQQTIIYDNKICRFEIEQDKKNILLLGLDEISNTMNEIENIKIFEKKLLNTPWI